MPKGLVIKADSGFYYIYTEDRVLEGKIRGKAKLESGRPYPGDWVEFQQIGAESAIIESIEPRKSLLQRPLIANGDQLLIVMSLSFPLLDYHVLDRLLIQAIYGSISPILILNKGDEAEGGIFNQIENAYPFPVYRISALTGEGIEAVKELLHGRFSILAGPSGVGKTSILNALDSRILSATGSLGEKLQRGRHTTRTTRFFAIAGGMLADTPGFSRVDLPESMKPDMLKDCYPEFEGYRGLCRFKGCLHENEEECGVKDAVHRGLVDPGRYERYRYFLQELKDQEERRYR